MLEDRIIVQDRGIDAGLAALMQNAKLLRWVMKTSCLYVIRLTTQLIL